MEKKEEKKVVAKAAAEVKQEVSRAVKRVFTSSVGPLAGPNATAQSNAMIYAAGLHNPLVTGIRVPDSAALPSMTTQIRQRVTINMFTVDTARMGGIVMNGSVAKQYAQVISNTLVWDTFNSDQYGALNGVAQAYRTVSFGLSCCDAGPIMNRGYMMWCGTVPTYQLWTINGVTTGQDPALTMAHYKTVSLMDSATCANQCHLYWTPLMSAEAGLASFTTLSSVALTNSSWRKIGSSGFTDVQDNTLVMWLVDPSGTATDNMVVDLTLNIEWIPLAADVFLGDPQRAIGSAGAMSEVLSVIQRGSGTGIKLNGFFSDIADAVRSVFKGLGWAADTVESWIPKVKGGIETIRGVGNIISPALAAYGARIDHAVVLHRIANLLDRPEESPLEKRYMVLPEAHAFASSLSQPRRDSFIRVEEPADMKTRR